MLRRIDVEFRAGQFPDALFERADFASIDRTSRPALPGRRGCRGAPSWPARQRAADRFVRRRVAVPGLRLRSQLRREALQMVGVLPGAPESVYVRVAQDQRGRSCCTPSGAEGRSTSMVAWRMPWIGPASRSVRFRVVDDFGPIRVGEKFAQHCEHLAIFRRTRRSARRPAPAKARSRSRARRNLRIRARRHRREPHGDFAARLAAPQEICAAHAGESSAA